MAIDQTALIRSLLLPLILLPTSLYFFSLLRKDYTLFLSLGPGGTPSTPLGYLRIKFLSLFALKHPYKPSAISLSVVPSTGHLQPCTLPKRRGPRPTVMGIAPHRQTNQKARPQEFALLERAIRRMATGSGEALVLGVSCIEKHGPALFRRSERVEGCPGAVGGPPGVRCSDGITHRSRELLHAHLLDGSMHLVLHPADVSLVLRQGWGELHPLAKGGWFSRFVPKDFMLIYAPRSREEVEIVMQIVRAACWWRGGDVLGPKDRSSGLEEQIATDFQVTTVLSSVAIAELDHE